MTSIYSFTAALNSGKAKSFADYKGRVLLIVNTASQCGFTPQYKSLQEIYAKYHARGLDVLGFPCNQFGQQEPGSDADIKSFCDLNYGVEFPIFSKIDVNGDTAHPLYKFLKEKKSGLLGGSIRWNFTKFLIDRHGNVFDRYAPFTRPANLEHDIEKLLK
jgi:glutathione peroxidase